MISIVVITYNRSELLKRTLISILDQSFTDFEIILVDDGSTDNTFEMIESLNDKRIRYLNQGRIGNLSKLRNIGILKSEKDFIAFCDDDDLWDKDKLKVQIKSAETRDFVCSNAKVIDINDKEIKEKYFDDINNSFEITYDFLLSNGNCILTSSCLIRRELLINNDLFFDEIKFTNFCEDFELFIRISKHSNIYFEDRNLILKRAHESVSGGLDNNIKMLKASIDILNTYKHNSALEKKYRNKATVGILGYKMLLVKFGFKKSIYTGLKRIFILLFYLFNPLNFIIFVRKKFLPKLS
ncbi:MAG: glycosyltransferase family 2 protein, partial [Ignavibacteriae bacterium]|nr:glycosyltransferase family 2 protein [Ignavibacteriota bacterium]